jgi:hypothetical protein
MNNAMDNMVNCFGIKISKNTNNNTNNYISINNKNTYFNNIYDLKIVYNNKIINFTKNIDTIFDVKLEYDHIKNIVCQPLCINNNKQCNGCISELVYICSNLCILDETQKIDLINYILKKDGNIVKYNCKSEYCNNNALTLSVQNKHIKLAILLFNNGININESPIDYLLEEIIYNGLICNNDVYNYLELLLKSGFTLKENKHILNVLLYWYISYNSIKYIHLYNQRENIYLLFTLLTKYNFENVINDKIIIKILRRSFSICAYNGVDNICANILKNILQNIDINNYIIHSQFLRMVHMCVCLFPSKNHMIKLQILLEGGLSLSRAMLAMKQWCYNEHDSVILTGICTHYKYDYVEIFIDYYDNNSVLLNVKQQLGGDYSHIIDLIDRKIKIIEFIKNKTGYKINKGIIKNIKVIYSLLLCRSVLNNNMKTIILYKILPFIFI